MHIKQEWINAQNLRQQREYYTMQSSVTKLEGLLCTFSFDEVSSVRGNQSINVKPFKCSGQALDIHVGVSCNYYLDVCVLRYLFKIFYSRREDLLLGNEKKNQG